ncbi:MAG: hypothetical protein PVSMB1_04690 [Gemmatimonadaceae bacterium]
MAILVGRLGLSDKIVDGERTMLKRTLLVLLLTGLTWVRSASADEIAGAKAHYERGSKLFELGRFDEAAKEYSEAFELKDDPAFLYNIAQANRLGGHTEQALFFYRSYLHKAPNAPNRGEVAARIQELQSLIEQQARAKSTPPRDETARIAPNANEAARETTAAQGSSSTAKSSSDAAVVGVRGDKTSPPGRTKKVVGLVVGAVGVGALAGGIVASVLTARANDKVVATANGGGVFDPSVQGSAKSSQAAEIGLYAAGGAMVVTGVVLYALGVRENRHAAAFASVASLEVGDKHVGATVRLKF